MSRKPSLKELIAAADRYLLFDGGMGTMLQQRGLPPGRLPELFTLSNPQVVCGIHREYVEAGSDIVSANTFGANRLKLGAAATPQQVISAAVQTAKNSGAEYVALDIGPIGTMLSPMGTLPVAEAYDIYLEQVEAGVAAGADLIIIETMSDLLETKLALLAAKQYSELPVIASLSFAADGRTFMGTDPQTAAITLSALGADAIGANCSLGPQELLPVMREMARWATVPLIVQANAGLPQTDGEHTSYNITPEEYAAQVYELAKLGVSILGGCCGTTPQFIRTLRTLLAGQTPPPRTVAPYSAVTSGHSSLVLDKRTAVIGERINPTGKKKLKEALRQADFDYILGEAVTQEENGAAILDVNVGLPELNEAEMLPRVVQEIQAVSHLPLQIDSSDPLALEAALLAYNGKPIVNSVNGKEESLAAILPLVKKYGASVVALTLDENGIPATAEERLAIARRICDRAAAYGIGREDIFVDCLALSAASNQAMALETIRAITLVRQQLGCHAVLGVSNVSFGLPQRDTINSCYLAMALGAGLDLPILNPSAAEYRRVIAAFRVLSNEDKNAAGYISAYTAAAPLADAPAVSVTEESSLQDAVLHGRKAAAAAATAALLKTAAPLEIIDRHFVPALDEVGRRYAAGQMFLPQMIAAAEAVQAGFAVLREQSSDSTADKGRIVLATVKGDIHDIGKNIVRMLLKNYGYQVIDLGRDVEPQLVVETVRQQQAPLVGLSALMTTTIRSMSDTVAALKAAGLPCRVMVGGAVLNEEYTQLVGADYYAADAMAAVRIAEQVFAGEKLC